ncbi:MAG: serine/threonine protein kinase [Planctomycetes bacterium]|nr:serine/threonine protein kinase [Planctomycetota bacterium]
MDRCLAFATILLAGVSAGGFAAVSEAAASDWPQFRGPGGLGVSDAKGLPVTWSADKNVLWKVELPGAGASSPIVGGDRIFVTCYSGYGVPGEPPGDMGQLKRHLVCLNLASGKIVWDRVVPAKQREERYEQHMTQHGYASSTPAADGERVYAFFGKSGVFAFGHDGKQLWEADVGAGTSQWCGSSLVLHKGLVIANAGVESGSLVALDRRTGREVWRAGGIRYSYNTPILVALPAGKTELVVQVGGGGEPGRGKLLGFDPDKGDLLWNCAGDDGYICPSAVAHDGVVYAVPRQTVMAVRAGGRGDVTDSHRLWTGRKGTNVPSPVVHDGHLYWAQESAGVAYCAEAKTGRMVYEQRLSAAGEIYASPLLADGKLYYLTRKGRTFVLAAKPAFEQLAVNELDDGSTFNASPAVAGGRLLLRSNRFIYCIGQRGEGALRR